MRKFSTTASFIADGRGSTSTDEILVTNGYTSIGDGGAATWKHNGVTGQTVSQSPAQLADALLNDASGNQWALVGSPINILSCGALDNSDSTLAIQAAINGQSSGDVTFPSGTFIITTSLTPKEGVNLVGLGGILKLGDSAETRIIYGDGVSNVSIDDLIFDGNSGNNTIDGSDAKNTVEFIDTSNSTQVTKISITNCKVVDALNNAFTFGAATYSDVRGCYIENAAQHGIATRGGSILDSLYCVFSGNKIKGAGGAGIIPMGNSKYCTVSHNTIEDTGPNGDGITCYDVANVGHSITGNTITNANNHGIHIGGNHISVTGNTINEVALISSGASGILVESRSGDADCQYASVTGNTVNCSNANVGAGIDVQDRASDITVTGNTVRNTASIGIRLQTGGGGAISGNTIVDSGTIGIFNSAYIRCNISGNQISNSNQDGISLINADQLALVSNNVYNSGVSVGGGTGFAIKVDSATDRVLIDGNMFRDTSEASLFDVDSAAVQVIFTPNNYLSDGSGMEAIKGTASATTTTLPMYGKIHDISGVTTITSITASYEGREVTLRFSGVLTLTDGSNLILNGNFVTTSNDTISLYCDGTSWFETGRSTN